MFLAKCLIRKNTPLLRKKLEKIGYRLLPNGIGEWYIPIEKLTYLVTNSYEDGGYIGENGKWDNSCIDCDDNEDLFLSLSAIRDDSDYMQWFKADDKFIFCDTEKWDDFSDSNYPIGILKNAKKATIEEIIEGFKNGNILNIPIKIKEFEENPSKKHKKRSIFFRACFETILLLVAVSIASVAMRFLPTWTQSIICILCIIILFLNRYLNLLADKDNQT